jgi:hypothetical protein
MVTVRATLTYWRCLLWIEARWTVDRLGYVIRPYDVHADRRRWRWQRPTPCGSDWWASLSQDQREELADAIARQLRDDA